jgi:hypothetical protein
MLCIVWQKKYEKYRRSRLINGKWCTKKGEKISTAIYLGFSSSRYYSFSYRGYLINVVDLRGHLAFSWQYNRLRIAITKTYICQTLFLFL